MIDAFPFGSSMLHDLGVTLLHFHATQYIKHLHHKCLFGFYTPVQLFPEFHVFLCSQINYGLVCLFNFVPPTASGISAGVYDCILICGYSLDGLIDLGRESDYIPMED